MLKRLHESPSRYEIQAVVLLICNRINLDGNPTRHACRYKLKFMLLIIKFTINSQEKERYKEPVRESLKALLAIGWNIEHSEADVPLSSRNSMRRQSKPSMVSYD